MTDPKSERLKGPFRSTHQPPVAQGAHRSSRTLGQENLAEVTLLSLPVLGPALPHVAASGRRGTKTEYVQQGVFDVTA